MHEPAQGDLRRDGNRLTYPMLAAVPPKLPESLGIWLQTVQFLRRADDGKTVRASSKARRFWPTGNRITTVALPQFCPSGRDDANAPTRHCIPRRRST
jgi:hypothetical protein